MKKTLYIIPGWESTTQEEPYLLLMKAAQEKGYEVILKDVDWKQPLSTQLFSVHKDAIIFGFSLGAISARLVAQTHPCKLLLLASMTPDYSFEREDIKKELIEMMGSEFIKDIINHLKKQNQAEKKIIFYGDQEEELADILVPNTQHELTHDYIEAIKKIL